MTLKIRIGELGKGFAYQRGLVQVRPKEREGLGGVWE